MEKYTHYKVKASATIQGSEGTAINYHIKNYFNELINMDTNVQDYSRKKADFLEAFNVVYGEQRTKKIEKYLNEKSINKLDDFLNSISGIIIGTEEEFKKAFMIGFNLVGKLKEDGYNIIGTGEMGISNTTTAESVISVLCNCSAEDTVGKGAGLTEEGYLHKIVTVNQIIDVNKPDPQNPCEVVQKVGGFDIAGLMGCFVGGAYFRIPIVIDGVISIASALSAYKLCPTVKDFMVPSHISAEKGYMVASKEMGLKPIFDLGMRLGEGSGCPFTMYVAEASVKIVNEMVAFDDTEIDKSKYIDIREE